MVYVINKGARYLARGRGGEGGGMVHVINKGARYLARGRGREGGRKERRNGVCN